MFSWKDYEKNSALFLDGRATSVAILKHKDFLLKDAITGKEIVMKSSCLDEAKVDSENFLKHHWEKVSKELEHVVSSLKTVKGITEESANFILEKLNIYKEILEKAS